MWILKNQTTKSILNNLTTNMAVFAAPKLCANDAWSGQMKINSDAALRMERLVCFGSTKPCYYIKCSKFYSKFQSIIKHIGKVHMWLIV